MLPNMIPSTAPKGDTSDAHKDVTPSPEQSPCDYLTHNFYPDTPPVSASQSHVDLTLSISPSLIDPDAEPIIAVLGVGYVGSHLVDSFRRKFSVIGFDVSKPRISELNDKYAEDSAVEFTSVVNDLARATHYLIAVPTLLRADKSIDSSYLRDAIRTVAQVARRGSTVIIESSVAVGMTRQLLGPIAVSCGLFAGMSPERVDPGRIEPPMRSIPKIISGLDDLMAGSLDAISRLYSQVFDEIVPVSKPEVAEMTKLYENCQRMMCIAYANEMADACIPHAIDPYEVCDAAATKPFGFMPYMPGLGVGGHCIPVNPFYLLSNSSFPLLQAASTAMWSRPAAIAERTLASLRRVNGKAEKPRKKLKGTHQVLVVGMAFKAGQSSLSNSPGLALARHLAMSREAEVTWADAMVTQEVIPQLARLPDSGWSKNVLETFDLIIVALRQHGMSFDLLDELEDTQVDMWCYRQTGTAAAEPKAP